MIKTRINDDYSDDDDDPYVDADGDFLSTEDVMSDVGDDIDDEEYHEALLGHREARNFRRKAEDVQDQLVTVHRVHKLVSCVVRLIIGHVTVHRWMMVLSSQRSEIWELTLMVRGPTVLLIISVLKSVRISWMTRCV